MKEKWLTEYIVPAPMKLANDGQWKPVFGAISKNSKITVKGRFAVWSKEAKEWGRDFQFLSKQAIRRNLVGDANYKITLQMLVPDRRRRDPHNWIEFISDQLQEVLDCDDRRFRFETLESELVVHNTNCGFRIQIEQL